jgi:GNAT superfamily N-acetyltransferase
MNLRYRPATLEDAPLLGLWNSRLYEDECNPGRKSLEEFVSRMRAWLAGGELKGILFETEEGPVAYALYRQDPECLYVRHFYVDRPFRRRSMGRRCVRLLLAEALPPGQQVALDVLETNPNGRAFWQAVGFRPYSRRMMMPADERG